MKVLKFGGTSLKNAEMIKNVANIIISVKAKKKIIILSASATITDTLSLITEIILKDKEQTALKLKYIKEFHIKIAKDLGFDDAELLQIKNIQNDLQEVINAIELINIMSNQSKSRILSYGEYLSTRILSIYLLKLGIENHLFDSTLYVEYDGNNAKLVHKNIITQKLETHSIIIFQGFIAKNTEGKLTTLGRGGSDFSASIIGEALAAKEIQIWTDVSGVFSGDPKLFSKSKGIKTLSYQSMKRIAFYGAKVLHHKSILPALNSNIPVKILNTYKPDDYGTILKLKNPNSLTPGIAVKKGVFLLEISGLSDTGNEFSSALFHKISSYGLNILHSNLNDDILTVVLETIPEELKSELDYTNFSIKNVDFVFIIDLNKKNSNKLLKLIVDNKVLHSNFDNINKTCILILDSNQKNNIFLNKIHSCF